LIGSASFYHEEPGLPRRATERRDQQPAATSLQIEAIHAHDGKRQTSRVVATFRDDPYNNRNKHYHRDTETQRRTVEMNSNFLSLCLCVSVSLW
jgi:hypothetical protein